MPEEPGAWRGERPGHVPELVAVPVIPNDEAGFSFAGSVVDLQREYESGASIKSNISVWPRTKHKAL